MLKRDIFDETIKNINFPYCRTFLLLLLSTKISNKNYIKNSLVHSSGLFLTCLLFLVHYFDFGVGAISLLYYINFNEWKCKKRASMCTVNKNYYIRILWILWHSSLLPLKATGYFFHAGWFFFNFDYSVANLCTFLCTYYRPKYCGSVKNWVWIYPQMYHINSSFWRQTIFVLNWVLMSTGRDKVS